MSLKRGGGGEQSGCVGCGEREVIKAAPFGRRRRLRLEAREREAETPALER